MGGGTVGQNAPADATIDPKALERAVQSALKNYFPPLESTSDARGTFYNKFTHEADGHDTDFLKKYGDDLDITLIFAALFSAVVSAFVVAIQTQLQPDYTQLSYDLLWMMANSTHQNPPAKPSSDSPWNGPDPNLVHVQAILFSSLAVSLLASFVAMLGKQWLNRYSKVMSGSLIDSSRDRQRKMNGMAAWGFKLVMESLPLMLQAALLLLGCALSKFLFTIDNLVAWVVVVFTASGFLFYLIIVIAAIISYDCPFQTPLSLIVRYMGSLFNERKKYLDKLRWFFRTFPQKIRGLGQQPGNNFNANLPLAVVGSPYAPPVLFGDEDDRKAYVLDSNCIAWMFDMSMDPDVILDIMKFIPEIIWHNGIPTTPLDKLYDTVLECFDYSSKSGSPVVPYKFKNKAYLSAKALLHLGIQRKFMGNESDAVAFDYILHEHRKNLGSRYFEGDSDLDSTLAMIDRVFVENNFNPIPWQDFSFTDPHHTWMSRILLCHAWGSLKEGRPLHKDVTGFVRHSLALVPPPPAQTVRDCLYIVGMALKIRFDNRDPNVIDIRLQIQAILDALIGTFQNPNLTNPADIDCALDAVELITALSEEEVATKSYELFYVIIRRPVSPVYTSEKKWKAARLALHGAYKWDMVLPPVKDPRPILDFLCHHFELVKGGEVHDGPVQSALLALAFKPTSETIKALKNFNPTGPSFVHGICHVFQKCKSPQLRKAALFFLPLIADKWFNTRRPVVDDSGMKSLCLSWASAVDEVWGTDDVREPTLAVLLDMINCPHWRPHIVPEKWKLLAHFDSVPDDSQPLARCLRNPGLVDAVTTAGNPDAAILWLKILLLKYNQLDPKVRDQLGASVKGAQRTNADNYLLMIQLELDEAEKELLAYGTWATTPAAVALKEKIDSHKGAIEFLKLAKRGR